MKRIFWGASGAGGVEDADEEDSDDEESVGGTAAPPVRHSANLNNELRVLSINLFITAKQD